VTTPRMFSLSASASLGGLRNYCSHHFPFRDHGCIHLNQAGFQPQWPQPSEGILRIFCGSLGAMMWSALTAEDSVAVFLF
jgi:hypothetical protein